MLGNEYPEFWCEAQHCNATLDGSNPCIKSPRFLGTQNGGTESYKAVLGVGFPLRSTHIQLI